MLGIKELENLQNNISNINQVKSFSFNNEISNILLSLIKKEKHLKDKHKHLEENILKLIKLREKAAFSKDIISLIDDEEYNESTKLIKLKAKEYKLSIKNINKLDSNIEKIKLFNKTISNSLKNISIQKQKEIIIKNFKGKKELSKEVIENILTLEKELKAFKTSNAKTMNYNINKFDNNISILDSKSSLYLLLTMHINLIKYKNVINEFKLDNVLNNNININYSNTITTNINKMITLIDSRITYLLESLNKGIAKQEIIDENYKDRFNKNINYIIKEIGYGLNYLDNKKIDLFKSLIKEYKFKSTLKDITNKLNNTIYNKSSVVNNKISQDTKLLESKVLEKNDVNNQFSNKSNNDVKARNNVDINKGY